MTTSPPDATNAFELWLRRKPTLAARLGYLGFLAGTLIGLWFARKPDSQGNDPALLVLLFWVIAGITHTFVRVFWQALLVSAIASGIGYVVLTIVFFPKGLENEMFGVGIIVAILLGAGVSLLLGAPIVLYRRAQAADSRKLT